MLRFALGNLFAKRIRTILSLVLLTMVLGGTIGLISLSSGMRGSVSTTFMRLDGIVVIAKGSADPLFSTVRSSLVAEIRGIEGISASTPEIWGLVVLLEGRSPLTKGWFSAVGYGGFDPETMKQARGGGLYGKAIVEGRFLAEGDADAAVISRKLAYEYKKGIGDAIAVNGMRFSVVGIYHTGSMFLDQSIIVPLAKAREMHKMREGTVSTVYVETEDASEGSVRAAAARIAALSPDIEAKTKYDWHKEFSAVLGNLDAFFTAQSAYVAVLGIIIVLLTMSMSVMERKREFGILKAVGWTRSDVMRLVLLESAFLGACAGVLGCAAGAASARLLGEFLPFKPLVAPWLVSLTFFIGVFLGVCGGIYPAFKAASLDPVEAMRTE